MKIHFNNFLALDIGDKRIGVARGNTVARLARGLDTIKVDGSELSNLRQLVKAHQVDLLIVGFPRNQSGEVTKQTKKVTIAAEYFAEELELPLEFQDESLTSVAAEKLLQQTKKTYDKEDIDKIAAQLILQDYLDRI